MSVPLFLSVFSAELLINSEDGIELWAGVCEAEDCGVLSGWGISGEERDELVCCRGEAGDCESGADSFVNDNNGD